MNVIQINEPQVLIKKLEDLYAQGNYIFRGQPDANAKYKLIPSAFRPLNLKIASQKFPIKRNDIEKKWFKNEELGKFIEIWTPGITTEHIFPSHPLYNLFHLYITIMQYNYSLHKYFENKPHLVSPDDKQFKKIIELHTPDFWLKEETFNYFIQSVYQGAIEYRDASGLLLKGANPFENLTGVDETFPQHYDIPTAALDWTYNPYVALYFALAEEFDKEIQTYLAKNAAPYFSIYAYKQIVEENNPILIKKKSAFINNLRAKRQEGTFTYFRKPCSFYLTYGEFPSVDYYDYTFEKTGLQHTFELIKFSIPRNKITLCFFSEQLKKRGLNKAFLLP